MVDDTSKDHYWETRWEKQWGSDTNTQTGRVPDKRLWYFVDTSVSLGLKYWFLWVCDLCDTNKGKGRRGLELEKTDSDTSKAIHLEMMYLKWGLEKVE